VTLLPSLLEGFNDYKLFVYGLAMVVIMVFMPDGLFHGIASAFNQTLRRRSAR
jgi:branched-chain amino acid transport system permease protein